MSIIILKKQKIWFGYSCQTSEGYGQNDKYICDLSQISIQFLPYKKNGCLAFYGSYTSPVERMVLRNFLPQEIAQLRKIDQKSIVNRVVPDLEAIFKKTLCLHALDGGKDLRFGGAFALASDDGIFEVSPNRDVSNEGSFYASRQGLTSYLLTESEPITEEKTREAIIADSWHFYGGKKIYDPMIFGKLGDETFALFDADNKPHEIRKEELECL